MTTHVELRDVAPRLATGAFILNSGLGKLKADEATARACTAWPVPRIRS